jgi:hypothetical protein
MNRLVLYSVVAVFGLIIVVGVVASASRLHTNPNHTIGTTTTITNSTTTVTGIQATCGKYSLILVNYTLVSNQLLTNWYNCGQTKVTFYQEGSYFAEYNGASTSTELANTVATLGPHQSINGMLSTYLSNLPPGAVIQTGILEAYNSTASNIVISPVYYLNFTAGTFSTTRS